MRFPLGYCCSVVVALLVVASSEVGAQQVQGGAPAQPMVAATATSQYFTGSRFRQPIAPPQFNRPAVAMPSTSGIPSHKPFSVVPQQATVSPYLNLFRRSDDTDLPNYHAFVLPQIQQQQMYVQQQQQFELMQRRLQMARPAVPAAVRPGQIEQLDYRQRFMNTGHFFRAASQPGLREQQ